MKKREISEARSVKQRFATRKLKVGMVSVLVGLTLFFGAPASNLLPMNIAHAAEAQEGNLYNFDGYTLTTPAKRGLTYIDALEMYTDPSMVPTKADIRHKELDDAIEWTITFNQASTPNMRSSAHAPEGYTSKPWFTIVLGNGMDFIDNITVKQGQNLIGTLDPKNFSAGAIGSPIRRGSLQSDGGVNLEDKMRSEWGIYGTDQYKKETALRAAIINDKRRAISVQYDGIADQTKPVTFVFKTNKNMDKGSRISAIYSSFDNKYTQQVVNSAVVTKNPNAQPVDQPAPPQKENEVTAPQTTPQPGANEESREAVTEEKEFNYPDNRPILLEQKDSTDIIIIIPDITQIKDYQGLEVRTTAETKKPSDVTWAIPPLFRIWNLTTTPTLENTYKFIGNGEDLFSPKLEIKDIGKNRIITVKDAKLSHMVKKGTNSYFGMSMAPYNLYAVIGNDLKQYDGNNNVVSEKGVKKYSNISIKGPWINDETILKNPSLYNINAENYSKEEANVYHNLAQLMYATAENMYKSLSDKTQIGNDMRVAVYDIDNPTPEEIDAAKEKMKEYFNSLTPNSVKDITADKKGVMKVTFIDGSSISNLNTVSTEGKNTVNQNGLKRDIMYAKDSDGDGLSDKFEKEVLKTDPFKVDTDGDGKADGIKEVNGMKPELTGLEKVKDPAGEKNKVYKYPGTDPTVGKPSLPITKVNLKEIKSGDVIEGYTQPYKTVALGVYEGSWALYGNTVADSKGYYRLEVGKVNARLSPENPNKYNNTIDFENGDRDKPKKNSWNSIEDRKKGEKITLQIWSDGTDEKPAYALPELIEIPENSQNDADYYKNSLKDPEKVLVKDGKDLSDEVIASIKEAIKKANPFAQNVEVIKSGEKAGQAVIKYKGDTTSVPFTKDKTIIEIKPELTEVVNKSRLTPTEIGSVKDKIKAKITDAKLNPDDFDITVNENGTGSVNPKEEKAKSLNISTNKLQYSADDLVKEKPFVNIEKNLLLNLLVILIK